MNNDVKTTQFTGTSFRPMPQCSSCERLAQCRENQFFVTMDNILFDCKGFYHVFKKIEEFNSYPFFDGGDMETYIQEVNLYEERHQSVPCLLMAEAANGALAAELALKYLIFRENHSFDCIHDLKELFYRLPEPHMTVLTNKIYTELCQAAWSLDKNLQQISDIFEHARYSFSRNANFGFTNFFTGFVHIICDYTLSLSCNNDDPDGMEEEQ